MNSAFHQACFLEAAALDPPHLQLAFSERQLSQRGTDLLWLRGSPAWLSGLLGHPGGAGDSAQRIEHLPFWGTVGPQTHSLVHSFVQACPGSCGGPAPEIRRGKPQAQAEEAQSCSREDQETVLGEARLGRMRVMVTTGGPGPACEVRAELPAAQRQTQRHKDQPQTGAESHLLGLFTGHEVTMSGDLADHGRGLDFNHRAVGSH